MEECVQEFRRMARGSGYKERLLIEKFKREINKGILQRLIESEYQPKRIKEWYERAIRLDRNIRESIREKEEKRRKIEEEEIREEKKNREGIEKSGRNEN